MRRVHTISRDFRCPRTPVFRKQATKRKPSRRPAASFGYTICQAYNEWKGAVSSAPRTRMLNQCTYIGNQPLSPSTHYVPDAPAAYISHALQEGSATDFVLEGTRKHIQYKWIQQFDQFWARLREDPDVKRSLGDWVSAWNTWPVCLLVGIMICEDVGISMDAAKIRERKAQGGILVGEIVLPSSGVNPLGRDVNPKHEATSSRHTATLQIQHGRKWCFCS